MHPLGKRIAHILIAVLIAASSGALGAVWWDIPVLPTVLVFVLIGILIGFFFDDEDLLHWLSVPFWWW